MWYIWLSDQCEQFWIHLIIFNPSIYIIVINVFGSLLSMNCVVIHFRILHLISYIFWHWINDEMMLNILYIHTGLSANANTQNSGHLIHTDSRFNNHYDIDTWLTNQSTPNSVEHLYADIYIDRIIPYTIPVENHAHMDSSSYGMVPEDGSWSCLFH